MIPSTRLPDNSPAGGAAARAAPAKRPSRPAWGRRPPRSRVDVLVVRSSTTLGLRRLEDDLLSALCELGLEVATAETDFRRVRRLFFAQPLIDLAQAAAIGAATGRALRRLEPRAIVYPTSHAAMLQPAARLRSAAIRFDSLAAQSRPGARNGLQRALERRSLRLARLLAPYALRSPPPLPVRADAPVAPLPGIVAAGEAAERRAGTIVCYAANPRKKGLDLAVAAWSRLRPPPRLVVAGIGRAEGEAFLERTGVETPPGIEWAGRLGPVAFRRLTAQSEIYLSASRFEDWGSSQLEALADGALLVSAPTSGPAEALQLARELDPRLVSESFEPAALAAALRRAGELSDGERRDYRRRARQLLAPYSAEAFRGRLRDDILPILLEGRPRRRPASA